MAYCLDKCKCPKKKHVWLGIPFGPFGPKVGKESRTDFSASKAESKRAKIDCFSTILALFRLRFRLFVPWGREAPGTHFGTLFPTLGPKGPNDLSSGQEFAQCLGTQSSVFTLLLGRKKRVYTTTVAPLLSRFVARPRGHRAE